MTKTPYTFTVIRYVHDKGAGEALNVGVLMLSPVNNYVAVKVEPRFERLSRTFSKFDGDVYRQTLASLVESVRMIRDRISELPFANDFPTDAEQLIRMVWPDKDLSFQAGPLLSGIARGPIEAVHDELFGRMVTSQAPSRGDAEHRSDEEVWTTYSASLRSAKISHLLTPRSFTTPNFEIEFEHAFQNAKWHVVQPVTMDFVKAESLQEKATRWIGNAAALEGHPTLAFLYILLGEPRSESHRTAYDKAKNLLHKMPVRHAIIEERDADAFAEMLASYMREHGIGVE